jgi:DNA-directed RNA polymerase specialized sigma24 family protein
MASAAQLAPEVLESYRVRLRYKVSYHLGGFCPDVEDIVQETLARFPQGESGRPDPPARKRGRLSK